MSGFIPSKFQFLLATGAPNASGQIYVYQTGTTTKVTIYSDGGLTTPLLNPLTLDANGEARFYVSGSVNLRIDSYDASAGFIESLDPILVSSQSSSAVAITGGTIDGTTIGATTPAAGTFTSLNGGALAGFRNAVINGDFRVNQIDPQDVGYALTTSVAYGSVDMWAAQMLTSAAATMKRVASTLTGFQYFLKIQRTASSVLTGVIALVQVIPTANSIPLAGQQVTLSFYGKIGANYSQSGNGLNVFIITGTGMDEGSASAVSGGWTGYSSALQHTEILSAAVQRFFRTYTIPSGAKELAVLFEMVPTGTAGADDSFSITGVQLEPGITASPYELRPFSMLLALCRHFYRKSFPYSTAPAQACASSNGALTVYLPTGATGVFGAQAQFDGMFAAPTVTTYNPISSNANWRDTTNNADRTANAAAEIGDSSFIVTSTGGGLAASNNAIHWSAAAQL